MSISPDCKAVKRACAVSGTYFTFSPSPRVAAATARHISTSMPDHFPLESAALKPAKPVCTPQMTCPRALMASSVLPAWAGRAANAAIAATDAANNLKELDFIGLLQLRKNKKCQAPPQQKLYSRPGLATGQDFTLFNLGVTSGLRANFVPKTTQGEVPFHGRALHELLSSKRAMACKGLGPRAIRRARDTPCARARAPGLSCGSALAECNTD